MAQRRLTHAFLKEQKERKERKSERVKEQKSDRAERAKKRKIKREKEQKSERAKERNKERAKEWKRERANSQPWYLTTELTHKYCFGPLMDMLRRFPKRLGLGWDTLLESLNILSLTIRILRVLLIIPLKGTRGDEVMVMVCGVIDITNLDSGVSLTPLQESDQWVQWELWSWTSLCHYNSLRGWWHRGARLL